MARLYANENFPFPSVEVLRRLGHEVLTTAETGQASKKLPDQEILTFATSQGLAVLTMNRRHFIRLHQDSPDHAGIIVCTLDLDYPGLASRIHAAISVLPGLRGQLIRIARSR